MGLETSAGVKAHAVAWILAHRSAFLFNAMQTFTESEHKATEALVETAGQSMEQVLHAEVPSLRQEIRELSGLLVPVLQGAAQFTQPFPKESPST
jgi:hypothetical protein